MHSLVQTEFGSPGKVLQLAQRPVPEPGVGQARVKLALSPIHNHDLATISGRYGYLPDLPYVPGTEAVGVVEALGERVTNLQIGQRVAGGATGAWAEYYLIDASRAIPVPDTIANETAAQLISMPLSARLLLEVMDVKPGDWIIQNAANGAVGKMLVGFGADLGVNVVGLVRRDAGVSELAQVGIANVVSSETEGWQDRIKEVTGGAPIVRGLDSIGGTGADDLLGVMAEGSTLYSFGAMSGLPLQISTANLLFKQARVEGFWLAKLMQTTPPALLGRLIREIVGKAAAGKLVLPVAEVFPLERIADALGAATTPGRSGKVMLAP